MYCTGYYFFSYFTITSTVKYIFAATVFATHASIVDDGGTWKKRKRVVWEGRKSCALQKNYIYRAKKSCIYPKKTALRENLFQILLMFLIHKSNFRNKTFKNKQKIKDCYVKIVDRK